jgi:hypothetical protein
MDTWDNAARERYALAHPTICPSCEALVPERPRAVRRIPSLQTSERLGGETWPSRQPQSG